MSSRRRNALSQGPNDQARLPGPLRCAVVAESLGAAPVRRSAWFGHAYAMPQSTVTLSHAWQRKTETPVVSWSRSYHKP